jgi:uncharacterized repeat protein (TIGR01451 family)
MEVAEMTSVKTMLRRLHYAALTLAAMTAATSAYAAGTPSSTQVDNLAVVSYDVSGITQEVIESSPTGNSTPGATNGEVTRFVVDNKVDLSLIEIGGVAQSGTPGSPTPVVATFRLTNEGNTAQDYVLSVANLTSSDPDVFGEFDTDVDMTSLQIYVDGDDDDAYTSGSETLTSVITLAPDIEIEVFVLANAPLGAQASDFANIRLTATTYDAGSGGAGSPTAETTGADTTGVDVVFADGDGSAPPDGLEFADDSFTFITADLSISKTSTVVEDPFNGLSANAKAIPGAFVLYEIVIANTGTVAADNIVINDTLPGEVRRALGRIGGSDIEIVHSVDGTTPCTFDPTGDTDGCDLTGIGGAPGLNGGTLTISPGDPIDTGESVTIRFQVEIL